jgi:hypothetical protein
MAVVTTKRVLGNWRVIVRFSLDYDKNSAVRNAVAPLLEAAGIRRTKTGTWESRVTHCTPAHASKQMRAVLRILENPQAKVGGAGPHALLDHLWVYIDRIK